MIGKREIVGLYLGEANVEAYCLRSHWGRWTSVSPPWSQPEAGPPLAEQVRGILSAVRPSRHRTLCLALPRSAFFLREIPFPQLESEEAVSAVGLGIGLHAHLEPDQIYHDQLAIRREGQTVVLVAYTPRSFLDPILRVIRETGHHKSLRTIAPATLGLDCLLRRSKSFVPPCTVLSRQGSDWVLSLHGPGDWEGSHPVSKDAETSLQDALAELSRFLPAPFERLGEKPAYVLGDSAQVTAEETPLRDPCHALKDLGPLCNHEKRHIWGLCAAALGLSAFPALSLQETPRRRPIHLRLKSFQLAAGGTAVALFLLTGLLGLRVREYRAEVIEREQEMARIKEQLKPLLTTQQEVELLEKRLQDLTSFRQEGPPTLETLKALTELTPADTWIKSFNLKDQKLRLTAEGGSAVEVLGIWRQNPLLTDVKLISPVTKDRLERERFSVEFQLQTTAGAASSQAGERDGH